MTSRPDIHLSFDPVHRYVPYCGRFPPQMSRSVIADDEIVEADLIEHPWVQRMRHIHQLQTAWYVFPSAEHSRFPHVVGAMHLGSLVTQWSHDHGSRN